MIRPLVLLFITFSTLCCEAQTRTTDTLLRMLTYGMPDMKEARIDRILSPKYGFKYHRVADCSITKELKDSVEQENKRVSKILEQRLGSDWEKRYNKEFHAMYDLQSQAEALVRKQPYIAHKIKRLDFKKDGLFFITVPEENPNVFFVCAFGWGKQKGKDTLIVNYNLTVDMTTKTVTKYSDKPKSAKSD